MVEQALSYAPSPREMVIDRTPTGVRVILPWTRGAKGRRAVLFGAMFFLVIFIMALGTPFALYFGIKVAICWLVFCALGILTCLIALAWFLWTTKPVVIEADAEGLKLSWVGSNRFRRWPRDKIRDIVILNYAGVSTKMMIRIGYDPFSWHPVSCRNSR